MTQSNTLKHTSCPQVFVLDIHFTFKSEKDRDKFIELWRPLARHVLLYEPGTLSYELAIADSDPLRVLVFERYRTKVCFCHGKC